MGENLAKTKNQILKSFNEARNTLKDSELSEDLILIKVGGYRNYDSGEKILEVSPEWTSNPQFLTEFLNSLKA
jgi:hypothetical protein